MAEFDTETAMRIGRAAFNAEQRIKLRHFRKERRDIPGTLQYPTLGFADGNIAEGATGSVFLAIGSTPGSESAGANTRTIVNRTGRTIWDGAAVVIEHTSLEEAAAVNWYAVRSDSASMAFGTAAGNVSEGATGSLTSVSAIDGHYSPTTLTYRVKEGSTETSQNVLVLWNEGASEWQHFCCVGGSPSMDIAFKISDADTTTGQFDDKVSGNVAASTFVAAEDLGIDWEIVNAAADEQAQFFYDMSGTASYSAGTFEWIAKDASDNVRMFSPADGYTHDGVRDLPIAVDAASTTGEAQFGIDASAIQDYSTSKFQFPGHYGAGDWGWFEFETSPGNLDSSPQEPRDTSEDILMSWEIDAADFKIQIFLDADEIDNAAGYESHTPAHPENLAHNSSGEPIWRNYADYQESETYNASNHIPVWMTEEDGTGGSGSGSQARLYIDPDGVPGTDPASGETTAVSIEFPSNAFKQTLIDPASGGIEVNATVSSTTMAAVNLTTAQGPSEHTSPDGVNEHITLERNGLWMVIFSGTIESAGGTGTDRHGAANIELFDATGSVVLDSKQIDHFSVNSSFIQQDATLLARIDISADTDIELRAQKNAGGDESYTILGVLHAVWTGDPD
jgi:hypothetical protein